MTPVDSLVSSLRQHQELAARVLAAIGQEPPGAGGPATSASRRTLLAELEQSLARLRRERSAWQRMSPDEKARHPQVTALMRETQDVVMRAILRDRENERGMLRAGQVPALHLGKVQADVAPNYVASLYRRHQSAS